MTALTLCSLAVALLSLSSDGNAAFHPSLWDEMAAELAAQQQSGDANRIRDADRIRDANEYDYGDVATLYGAEPFIDGGGEGWGDIVRDEATQRENFATQRARRAFDIGEDYGAYGVSDAKSGYEARRGDSEMAEGALRDAAGGADDVFQDVVARMADYIDWDDLEEKEDVSQQQHQRSSSNGGKAENDEDIHHSHIFGSDAGDRFQHMTGGAGEGLQWLKPEGTVQNKQEVKTDRFLPAYCDPPNPCPVGFTAEDGCDPAPRQKFTADYSKLYQSSQECQCDREHNYGCSSSQSKNKSVDKEENDLLKNNLKDLARMFSNVDQAEEKRGGEFTSAQHNNNIKNNKNNIINTRNKKEFSRPKPNPYLVGEPLKRVAKKFPTDFRM